MLTRSHTLVATVLNSDGTNAMNMSMIKMRTGSSIIIGGGGGNGGSKRGSTSSISERLSSSTADSSLKFTIKL